jgi:hypothetical protein
VACLLAAAADKCLPRGDGREMEMPFFILVKIVPIPGARTHFAQSPRLPPLLKSVPKYEGGLGHVGFIFIYIYSFHKYL